MKGIGITSSGLEAANTALRVSANRLSNLTPLMQRIAVVLERNAEVRFDTKVDPDGKPWARWSKRTDIARKKEGRGTLLEYSGLMRQSLGSAFDPKSAIVFIGANYSGFHEMGLGQPTRRILRSAADGLGRQDSADIKKLIDDYLNGFSV